MAKRLFRPLMSSAMYYYDKIVWNSKLKTFLNWGLAIISVALGVWSALK